MGMTKSTSGRIKEEFIEGTLMAHSTYHKTENFELRDTDNTTWGNHVRKKSTWNYQISWTAMDRYSNNKT